MKNFRKFIGNPEKKKQKGDEKQSMGQHQEAIVYYDKALALDENYLDAWYSKGFSLKLIGKIKEAIICYDRALKIDDQKEKIWFQKGLALHQQAVLQHEGYKDAIKCFKKCIELDNGHVDAWLNLGMCLRDINKFAKAIESLNKALKLKPEYQRAYHIKGLILYQFEKYEEAIASFDMSVELNRSFAISYFYKGLALHQLNRYQDALTSFDMALNLNRKSREIWLHKGLALHQLSRYKDAIACYDQATDFLDTYQQAWHHKGLAYHFLANYKKAIASFDIALRLNDQDETAWCNKGWTLLMTHKPTKAYKCFKKALKLSDTNNFASNALGYYHLYKGRWEHAAEQFKKVIKQNSDKFTIALALQGFGLLTTHEKEQVSCLQQAQENCINDHYHSALQAIRTLILEQWKQLVTKPNIENLTPELLHYCFSFLKQPKELANLAKTNHTIRKVALDLSLWIQFRKLRKDEFYLKWSAKIKHDAVPQIKLVDMTILHDGRLAICADRINDIIIFNPATKQQKLLKGHDDPILCLKQLSNNRLVSLSNDKTIRIWDLTCDNYKVLNLKINAETLAILPNDQLALSGYTQELLLWDLQQKKTSIIRSNLKSKKKDSIIKLFDRKTGTILALPNNRILTSSKAGAIYLWDINSRSCDLFADYLTEGQVLQAHPLALLRDGRVASAGADIRIYNLDTGKFQTIGLLERPGWGDYTALEVLPDGRLVSIDDKYINVWELETGYHKTLAKREYGVPCGRDNKNHTLTTTNNNCVIYGDDDGKLRFFQSRPIPEDALINEGSSENNLQKN